MADNLITDSEIMAMKPLSITDSLITNKSKKEKERKLFKKKCISIICASVMVLVSLILIIYLIGLKNDKSNIATSEIPSNMTNATWFFDTNNGRTSSSQCYPQSMCRSGFMDKTNGNANWWQCGINCVGGPQWTDNGCNCACISTAPCITSDESDESDLCNNPRDYSYRNADPNSWALTGACLLPPQELQWQYSESDDSFSATINVDAKYFSFQTHKNGERPCNFWTRVHNNRVPSPSMIMKPGRTYKVLLENDLGPNHIYDLNVWNQFRLANTTNLHVHGLHISGEPPADNLVRVNIDPGYAYQYTWNLPCNQVAGTYMYHAHFHGSTALQVGGGMAGLLIVEQNENVENYPEWLVQIPERLMQILRVNLKAQTVNGENFNSYLDTLTEYEDDGTCLEEFWLVNGEYAPTICITYDTFFNFRISHVDTEESLALYIEPEGCELYLIAKDGVTLNDRNPRQISHLYFTLATRADIAIRCSHQSQGYRMREGKEDTIIATIIDPYVAGISSVAIEKENVQQVDIFEEPLNQILRANYLENLIGLNDNLFDEYHMSIRRDNGVNGNLFQSANHYVDTMDVGKKIQWNIESKHCDGPHPFHMHVNHFQVMSCMGDDSMGFPDSEMPSNWIVEGDWHDVIDSSACIRFQTDLFGGDALFHCHEVNHEDRGIMGQMQICKGGCGSQWDNYNGGVKCVNDGMEIAPCLYSQYSDYCASGNPGQLVMNWYFRLRSDFRLRNKKYGSCVQYYTYSCYCGRGGCSTCHGTQPVLCDDTYINNQYFIMYDNDNNNEYFRIKPRDGNYCIRFSGPYYNGCYISDDSYWRIIDIDGEYFRLQNKNSGLCMYEKNNEFVVDSCGDDDSYWLLI